MTICPCIGVFLLATSLTCNRRKDPFAKLTTEWTRRHEIVFFACRFGVDKFHMTSRLRVLLTSLSQIIPRATFVVSLSPYTDARELTHHDFDLDIRIGRVKNNLRRKDFHGKPADAWSLLRASFYRDYLSEHPEIEYVFYCDDDVIILRNPMELLENDTDVVHIMSDAFPLLNKEDANYIWLNAWNNIDQRDRDRCNINPLPYSLEDPMLLKRIPLNAGLMCGKAVHVLAINRLLAEKIECMRPSGKLTDQGLLNLLWLNGQLNTTRVRVIAHGITGKLVSCPEFLGTVDLFLNADKIIAMHHWYNLNRARLLFLGERVAAFAG